MTDIILVTYNRLNFTKKVIESIIERTKSSYRLIVVDNGSDKETDSYLRGLFADETIDELILNKENKGLETALNQGFQLVTSKYFVFKNQEVPLVAFDSTPLATSGTY